MENTMKINKARGGEWCSSDGTVLYFKSDAVIDKGIEELNDLDV